MKALEVSESENTSTAYVRNFLAMTDHQLAQAELTDSPVWNRKLTLELLQQEAETLIGIAPPFLPQPICIAVAFQGRLSES